MCLGRTLPTLHACSGETGRNACADKCCGSNDTAHYCLWDLENNATLEDMVNNNEAKHRLTTAIRNYKATGQPFFVGQGYGCSGCLSASWADTWIDTIDHTCLGSSPNVGLAWCQRLLFCLPEYVVNTCY
jgi:hypothetical protein